MSINVTKRNGSQEKADFNKVSKVIEWAAEGLTGVSVSTVELRSKIQFNDGIKTSDIHAVLVKTAADLISEDTPNYQYLAARLSMFDLRKRAFGQFEPPSLYTHINKMVQSNLYDKHLIEDYDSFELAGLNDYIRHERDMTFAYAAVKQLEGKYLVQNRVTKQVHESPQMLYMCVAMALFSKYNKNVRMDYVKRFYDAVSLFKISLPTPIMGGVRTPSRQFSSCVLIESGDSLDSINATPSGIV